MQTATRQTVMLNFDPSSIKAQEVMKQIHDSNEFVVTDDIFAPIDLRVDPNYKNQPHYTHEEFWDAAYKELGRLYGMNDIRDAK